jgi:hypothetical protein
MTTFWNKRWIRDIALIVVFGCVFFLGYRHYLKPLLACPRVHERTRSFGYRHYLKPLLGLNEKRPRVGDMLEPFNAFDIEGRLVSISHSGLSKPRVLMVLSPTCSECLAMVPVWIKIYSQHDSRRLEFLGVSLRNAELT